MPFILAYDVNINDLNIQKLTNCALYPRLVIIHSHLIKFQLNNMSICVQATHVNTEIYQF